MGMDGCDRATWIGWGLSETSCECGEYSISWSGSVRWSASRRRLRGRETNLARSLCHPPDSENMASLNHILFSAWHTRCMKISCGLSDDILGWSCHLVGHTGTNELARHHLNTVRRHRSASAALTCAWNFLNRIDRKMVYVLHLQVQGSATKVKMAVLGDRLTLTLVPHHMSLPGKGFWARWTDIWLGCVGVGVVIEAAGGYPLRQPLEREVLVHFGQPSLPQEFGKVVHDERHWVCGELESKRSSQSRLWSKRDTTTAEAYQKVKSERPFNLVLGGAKYSGFFWRHWRWLVMNNVDGAIYLVLVKGSLYEYVVRRKSGPLLECAGDGDTVSNVCWMDSLKTCTRNGNSLVCADKVNGCGLTGKDAATGGPGKLWSTWAG